MKGNGGKIALSSMALFKVITGKNIYYLDTTYSIYWSLRHFMTEKMCIFVSFLPKVSVRQISELRPNCRPSNDDKDGKHLPTTYGLVYNIFQVKKVFKNWRVAQISRPQLDSASKNMPTCCQPMTVLGRRILADLFFSLIQRSGASLMHFSQNWFITFF